MIKFAHPEYLWIFTLVLILFFVQYWYRRRRDRELRRYSGEQLVLRLLDDFHPSRYRWRQRLIFWAVLILSLALIGPKVGQKLTEVKRKGIDIIIAFDTSISMNAEDVKPNRLSRAKYETGKFIQRLRGDRVGLVAFAGISYLQCPLTLDYSAAKLFLDTIDAGVIGTQGTAIADAIRTSLKAFKGEDKKHNVLIVISDGEDHEGEIEVTIEEARKAGVVIYSVGVGTLSGAPIPISSSGGMEFKKDRSGHVVTTVLKEGTLRKIATATGGKYYNMRTESNVFEELYQELMGMEKKELRSHEYSDYQERYQIFLVIGILLLIIEMLIPEKGLKTAEQE